MFYESSIVDFEDPSHCICLEQNSTGKRQKNFEAGGFPCCILHNTYFFSSRSRKSKKIQDVRKSGDISKQKVLFYDEDYVYQASKL